jgi:GxxExxY protein
MNANKTIVHKDLAYEVMGAVYEVHNELGAGFLEKVYERALLEEFNIRGINAVAQKDISVLYKGRFVGHYTADIVVEDKILLELKSIESLSRVHEAQILNYLKATGLRLGILINFGNERVESKRFAF